MKIFCKINKLTFAKLILPILLLFTACNPTRHLKQNEYLLEKNIVLDNQTYFLDTEIEAFIRQKPNRKIAKLVRFHLWLYNRIDLEKTKQVKQSRNERYDRINAERSEKTRLKNNLIDKENEKVSAENKLRVTQGKRPKKLKPLKKPKLKDKEKLTWRESILEVAEAPTILDTNATKVSKVQIEKYLNSKGYFNSVVKDSTVKTEFKRFIFKHYKKRASVYYKVYRTRPYHIKDVQYHIHDEQLRYLVFQDTTNSLLKKGMRYDADVFQQERERIVKAQKNNGYYNFNQNYVYYTVDTNLRSFQMNVNLFIKDYSYKPVEEKDSVISTDHIRYTVNNIYVIPNASMSIKNQSFYDTITGNQVIFLSNGPLKYRKKDLENKIIFQKNDFYHHDLSQETYNKLADLRTFKNINIQYKPLAGEPKKLDCYIYLSPVLKQSFVIETEGTNTNNNLGIAGSFVYQNRNVFRGAELLELKLKGGFTAQKNFTNTENTSSNPVEANVLDAFNTLQFGPEFNLYIPKELFPFSLFNYHVNASPKTIFTSSLNYQKRPEFSRVLTNISYGFQFRSHEFIRQSIVPFEFNIIQAKLTAAFKDQLNSWNDIFLQNSFTDHVTTVSRYSLTYNDQTNSRQSRRIFHYFKTNLESGGNILRGVFNLTNEVKDSLGRYHILKVPFAQFLRIDLDYRVYKNIRKLSRLVLRAAGGVGKPLHNLRVLPYEKSFFGGGPNSVRAWKSRALGPGSYSQPDTVSVSFDKIGDVQLDFNLEYRFNIYKFLNGAWFIDAGNIWLRKPDPLKPGGDFEFNRFYKEIAAGSGFGLRADFSFFIIRLDAAFKLYNPSLKEGDRWMLNKQPIRTTVFNFGIGYPF